MWLDKETDILKDTIDIMHNTKVFLLPNNSLCKKIKCCMYESSAITDNSAHSSLPPDFYSDKNSFMFDVMRVNDSEVKKTYNPVLIEQRNMEKEVIAAFPELQEQANIITMPPFDENQHNIEQYRKQCVRVTKEHLQKIPIWRQEHPDIKYSGFLIYDESEEYFDGAAYPIDKTENKWWLIVKHPVTVHFPWNDKVIMQHLYNAGVDFIIWVTPYKPYGDVCRKMAIPYPDVTILDVRYLRNARFADYSNKHFIVM